MSTSPEAVREEPDAGAVAVPHVELRGVTKRFGGITALADLDLQIEHATVHALIGENGAGKSTLGRVICGAHLPDLGTVLLDGQKVQLTSPRHALSHGIALISQEPTLVPQRTVLDNVFLGQEVGPLGFVRRRRELVAEFATLTEQSGFEIAPSARVRDLSMAQKQRVMVIRALARHARLIVMDEPTSTLTSSEAAQLLALVGTCATRAGRSSISLIRFGKCSRSRTLSRSFATVGLSTPGRPVRRRLTHWPRPCSGANSWRDLHHEGHRSRLLRPC